MADLKGKRQQQHNIFVVEHSLKKLFEQIVVKNGKK